MTELSNTGTLVPSARPRATGAMTLRRSYDDDDDDDDDGR